MPSETAYIWGFPGVGKSSLKSHLRIVDADSRRFQFQLPPGALDGLHGRSAIASSPNPKYPQNYLDYVFSVDADVVLINCHINLLDHFKGKNLLLVYPSQDLKAEYIERYQQRGDDTSFVQYMSESFEDILQTIQRSPYHKYEISESNIYLQNLIERGAFMNQFLSKKDLTQFFSECMDLGVYTPEPDNTGKTAAEHAQMLFDDEIAVNLHALKSALDTRKAEIAQERQCEENRGGLTHDELKEKIQQGIVNGALSIRHSEISPYSYGFEVLFGGDRRSYTNRWECYCPFSEVAERVTSCIEAGQQSHEVYSNHDLSPLDIKAMLRSIDAKENEKITSFVEESKSGLERRGHYSGHVATLQDVHSGLALDGIIRGHFSGDYSSMTTNSQNQAMRTLVAMKGFCLDCIDHLDRPDRKHAVDYLEKHGTDISTPEKLQAWIQANPDKCGLPGNRERKQALDQMIGDARAKTDPPQSSREDISHDR